MQTRFLSILLFFVLLVPACSQWLDLKPYGEVEQDKMFEEEKGFLQTLTGTYTLLSDKDAYGNQLTAGFVEAIVHNWKKYNAFYDFNYSHAEVTEQLNATWLQLYRAIANINLVLQNLEAKKQGDFEYYNLIKGEALGLRAYIHLDILRLFGPVLLNNDLNQKAIPYHEEFSNQAVHLMTVSEVLEKAERDLKAAYLLLHDDPIKKYGRKNEQAPDIDDLAFQFRGIRMNYYAVCATLARLYMLKSEPSEALNYANEVIGASGIFTLVQRSDMAGGVKNLMFERELVWALFDQKIADKLAQEFSGRKTYTVDEVYKNSVYTNLNAYGSLEDYRCSFWDIMTSGNTFCYLKKYQRSYFNAGNQEFDNTPWEKVLPMIRLSEMYYIAAEANLRKNPSEAYRLLNEVRRSRNLSDLPDVLKNNAHDLLEQIVWEYRKDFWGEGKIFYLYKRLFRNIVTQEENIPASRTIYELPVPKDEFEFGANLNN